MQLSYDISDYSFVSDEVVSPVLVLGLGNILLQDEGIGVRVIERLKRDFEFPADVEVLDGGTAGMALYEHIIDREHLVVVDAVKTGRAPGTLITLNNDEVPAFFRNKVSPHQLALSDILAALQIAGNSPPQITVIGIEPLQLDTGLDMSATVTDQIGVLVKMVVEHLCQLGYAANKISSAHTKRNKHE
jgi:hydrogenase maturation protease